MEMLFSILFATIISGILIYLYRIIKSQKELSEVNNILKTILPTNSKHLLQLFQQPLKGRKNFSENDDKEKTGRYLDLSDLQLSKLNTMVEELLETAAIDNEKLIFKPEKTDSVETIEELIAKFKTLDTGKLIILRQMVLSNLLL